MVRDSASRAILTRPHLLSRLAESCRPLAVDVTAIEGADSNPASGLTPDRVAYVIYTSGSTGAPKGCLVTHRNVVRLMKNNRHDFDFHAGDVWLVAHSFSFDFSVWEMYGALLYGGCAVIASEHEVRDTAALRSLIVRHRVTILNQTPGAFYALIEEEMRHPQPALAGHLRYVIFGGDRLEPAYLRRWVERYPLDRIALINMYGITETTVHVTWFRLRDEDVQGPAGTEPGGTSDSGDHGVRVRRAAAPATAGRAGRDLRGGQRGQPRLLEPARTDERAIPRQPLPRW